MFVNGEVYNVGTVVNDETNNTTTIVGIILGIVAALVVGASLALAVMVYLRKKKTGEETRGKNNAKSCRCEHNFFKGTVRLLFSFFFFSYCQLKSRIAYQPCCTSTVPAALLISPRLETTGEVSHSQIWLN